MTNTFYDPKHKEWHWIIGPCYPIPIPDELLLTILRLMLIEKLKVRMFLMAKVFDGGKEIRVPLNYDKGGKL